MCLNRASEPVSFVKNQAAQTANKRDLLSEEGQFSGRGDQRFGGGIAGKRRLVKSRPGDVRLRRTYFAAWELWLATCFHAPLWRRNVSVLRIVRA
jgi:hypothetical protein